ncbi:MAG: kelch repeat-containing protein, partial [Gemmatimonadaceae bacterium]|nr:kelch repeat-containing protein [Gemmatimonadaceae bacterium]
IIGANNISFPDPTKYLPPQMNGILSGVHGLDYVLEIRKPTFFGLFFNLNAFSVASQAEKLLKERVDIINISITSAIPAPKIVELTNKIYSRVFSKGQNTLFVVSAGQFDFLGLDGVNAELVSPASLGNDFGNVITVGATDPLEDTRMSSSNFGSAVNIAAPGLPVYAPAPRGKGNFPDTGDYENSFGGTSASAPMVTGVAGLIKAIKPDLTSAQIKSILTKTENTDPVVTEPDKPIGRRLNALKAVCDAQVLNCAPTPPPQPSNTWQSVGPMTTERADHTATLLNDGKVLITGGFKGTGNSFTVLASAEVFNPASNTFIPIGNMTTPRTSHTATLLPDGRVLIAGGQDNGGANLKSAEIFNPNTNSFIAISNMNEARFYHAANLLNDGRVLIAGGVGQGHLKSTEIFDPAANQFSAGPDMTTERFHAASVLLNDGRVLIVNGLTTLNSLKGVDIYNPSTNNFTSATSSAEQLGLSV